jgi:hypothetical protein
MSIVLLGSTSGSCTLQEQAVAGTTTLTLPTVSGTVGVLVSGSVVAPTSGTSIDFTGIPSGVRRVTISLSGVTFSATATGIVQLGTSGGIQSTSYVGSVGYIPTPVQVNVTTGFGFLGPAATTCNGAIVLTLIDASTGIWSATAVTANSVNSFIGGGAKTLSGTLTQFRITTVAGTPTFTAGSINILYE